METQQLHRLFLVLVISFYIVFNISLTASDTV